jgi:hypothetical protein
MTTTKTKSLALPTSNSSGTKDDEPICEHGQYHVADLKLSNFFPPLVLSKFHQRWGEPNPFKETIGKLATGSQLNAAVGSATCDPDKIFFKQDTGIFQCVHEAWMNHWNLRTSPEDWWYPVASTVAKAVSSAAKRENSWDTDPKSTNDVRDLFVNHSGKDTISVSVEEYYIDDADYDAIFQQISEQLEEKIKIPEYVQCMVNDFSTTTMPSKIASEINLMSSLQEFFQYEIYFMGCGIRSIEMYGDQTDWDRLNQKLLSLQTLLEPIKHQIYLDKWFQHVSYVFQSLALTRKEPTNPEVKKFWSKIITKSKDKKYENTLYGMGQGRTHMVDAYDGWLIKFLTGEDVIKLEDIQDTKSLSGLNEVPVKVKMIWCDPPVSEEVKLLAGVFGFQLHDGKDSCNGVPSLQPVHMWSMLVRNDSQLTSCHDSHLKSQV